MSRLRISGLAVLVAVGVWLLAVTAANAQDPAQIELGARLYVENCAVCHGDDGQGRVGATLAKDWPSIRPDLRIKETIDNGIAGSPMPAWSQANGGPLSEAEIDSLVAYILTWESGGPRVIPPTPTRVTRPPLTPPPDVAGDPNRGAVLYDQNCAVCHGANGEGRVGATLSKDFPSIRPDLLVRNTIALGVQGSVMPAWSQANGGPLTGQDIDDLTAFILSLPVPEQAPPAEAETAPPARSWLSGWGGVVLAVLLFSIVIMFALWVQSRKPG